MRHLKAARGGAPRPQIAIARGEKIAYNDEIKLRFIFGEYGAQSNRAISPRRVMRAHKTTTDRFARWNGEHTP